MKTSLHALSLAAMLGTGWLLASLSQNAGHSVSTAVAREPRFPQLRFEDLNAQQRPLAEKIMKVSSVGIGGPYNLMLRSPVFAERAHEVYDYLRWHSSLPARLSEFAILIQGRLWRSQVEWFAHYPLAIKAGLSEAVAADLKANRRPGGMKPDEEAVYDFCMDLSTKHAVSDEVFDRLRTQLNDQQVIDLIGISGNYVTTAMLLAAAEQSVPPGKQPPFSPGEP
ncbi:carboxymuconolactone decarboxylase family protein [Methylobacterium sp. J-070]|uniref:carboxymuconolactone decarboxylase family protein n=1 Tax=Methylobacterium sp. J-070 TaxID=2836650 RepID=UPI001FB8E66D|nr:carboxymuconolactone decarboxylase family protein [Methylobacterium sp. J-070]MCJ2052607.1 carboxymuconolactone decarboxylase family protein [Methylobacterium sp. J-070]